MPAPGGAPGRNPGLPWLVGAGASGIRYLADSYLPTTAGRSQPETLPSYKRYTEQNFAEYHVKPFHFVRKMCHRAEREAGNTHERASVSIPNGV